MTLGMLGMTAPGAKGGAKGGAVPAMGEVKAPGGVVLSDGWSSSFLKRFLNPRVEGLAVFHRMVCSPPPYVSTYCSLLPFSDFHVYALVPWE